MRFWVDIDNAPHVQVLAPIIRGLMRRGHEVEITARDYGQTVPLLAMHGFSARVVGRHAGRNIARKYLSTIVRSVRLAAFGWGRGFDAVLCHGARGVYPAARLLRLPLITMGDYEHATMPAFLNRIPVLSLFADAIPLATLVDKGVPPDRIRFFPGLKEDLYVHDCAPDPSFLHDMDIDRSKVIVLVRPPATMAHYAVKESAELFRDVLAYLGSRGDVELILVPRTYGQAAELRLQVARAGFTNVHFPGRVYDGPSLVWFADLVIGGGGTMNREAAALGVPVVSIYEGKLGAVDLGLIESGRLTHVRSVEELRRLPLRKRRPKRRAGGSSAGRRLRQHIIAQVFEAVSSSRGV